MDDWLSSEFRPFYKRWKSGQKGLQDFIRYAQNYIKIEKVVLFGSYARGSASPESDIDIAIDLQPFPFSPEQFEGDHFFVEEIRRNEIDITDQVIG